MTHVSTTAYPRIDGQVCSMFAADLNGSTREGRDDDIQRYVHEKLYEIYQKAFDSSGIPWAQCFWEDRGDGVLVIVPPAISGQGIIDPLPERLRVLIRRHNHVSRDEAGMQLRVAAHTGPVHHDGHGFVGSDVTYLFRMLDAQPLRRALAASGAELALIVSDYLYRTTVCRHPVLASPDAFRPVKCHVKKTAVKAWVYVPGASSELTGHPQQPIVSGPRGMPGKHALRSAAQLPNAAERMRHLA